MSPTPAGLSPPSPRRGCILDPELLLSEVGPHLALGLSGHLDVWITRELWHVLDNSCVFLESPERLFPPSHGRPGPGVGSALRLWEHIRSSSHLGERRLFWIGDALSTSLLPDGASAQLLPRWERAARQLESACSPPPTGILAAHRDTLALLLCLPGALALSPLPPDGPPALITALASFGLSGREAPSPSSLATLERDLLHRALVEAGLQAALWRGGRLAVVHAFSHLRLGEGLPAEEGEGEEEYALFSEPEAPLRDPLWWEGTELFWYPL